MAGSTVNELLKPINSKYHRQSRALSGSGSGGHEGGEDVVGVSVEVLAGAVVAHGGAWVGVAGGDLDVADADAGVEHGGDESVQKHVRMQPRISIPAVAARRRSRRVAACWVHPGAERVAHDRTVAAAVDCPIDGLSDGRRQRDQDDLAALAVDLEDAMAVFLAQVADVRVGCSKIRSPSRPSMAIRAKSVMLGDSPRR
jgi:hypothetical protein